MKGGEGNGGNHGVSARKGGIDNGTSHHGYIICTSNIQSRNRYGRCHGSTDGKGRYGCRIEFGSGDIQKRVEGECTKNETIQIEIGCPVLFAVGTNRKDISVLNEGTVGVIGDGFSEDEIIKIARGHPI